MEIKHEKVIGWEGVIRIKRILTVLLHNGINRAIKSQFDNDWNTFGFIRVSEHHISMVTFLGHLLSDKQFMNLNNIMEALKDMNYYERDDAPYKARQLVDKLIKLLKTPVYPLYKFHIRNLQSSYDILSEEVIQLLNILYKEEN